MPTPDSYTKLLLHGDGVDLTTDPTGWDTVGKDVTNTATYDSYTKLCSHFDGADAATAYQDPCRAGAAGAWTFVNQAQLDTAATKFKWTSSLLLDGAGDSVTLPAHADWYWDGDFTVDFWAKWNDQSGAQMFFGSGDDGSNCYYLVITGPNVSFGVVQTASNIIDLTWNAGSVVVDTWYHYALVRNGNNFILFRDGVSAGTQVSATAIPDFGGTFRVGNDVGGTYFNGWIDEFRVSKGIARWTTDFTPPVAPYGQVTIDTGVKKFGTGSLLFGGGSHLNLDHSDDWNFADDDFTMDCWIYLNNNSVVNTILAQDNIPGEDLAFVFGMLTLSTLGLRYSTNGSTVITKSVDWSPSVSTWYHVAVIRNGNNLKFFVNGTQQGATQDITSVTIFNSASGLQVGNYYGVGYFDGYIDELRISKGVARWTADFTVPDIAYAKAGSIQCIIT